MGKFTGLLLASDYDNTLTYTEEALRLCQPMPPVPDAVKNTAREPAGASANSRNSRSFSSITWENSGVRK